MNQKALSVLFLTFSLLGIWAFYLLNLHPQLTKASTGDVTISVKISVCGDGVIEGPEDCEGSDLDGATCSSLGYEPGTLTCDIACTYDTSQCGPKITPTPTPTPTSTPTSDSSSDTSTTTTTTSTSSTDQTTTTQPLKQLIEKVFRLPQRIRQLDPTTTSDDRITTNETEDVISRWVSSWRSFIQALYQTPEPSGRFSCDLNNDKNCNLSDLSILLYYINR